MLVKKSEITKIDMVDISEGVGECLNDNDFCVRFHLKSNGCIILPCFYVAGFDLDDLDWVEEKEKQIRLTQEYLDQHPDDAYVELNAGILYNMDVYH